MTKNETKNDTENAADLAKEYVDLWEQQISALAKDPAVAETMAQTLAMMHAGALQMNAVMNGVAAAGGVDGPDTSDPTDDRDAKDPIATASAESRTATDGAQSGGSDLDLRELSRRVAELEQRLRILEQKP